QQPLPAAREPARLTFREGRSPSNSSTAVETIAEPLPLARETGKASRLSTRTTSRGKTRGGVQVSGDPSDAFKDPFGDDADSAALPEESKTSTAFQPESAPETSPSPLDETPVPRSPRGRFFPEDQAPLPPNTERGLPDSALLP